MQNDNEFKKVYVWGAKAALSSEELAGAAAGEYAGGLETFALAPRAAGVYAKVERSDWRPTVPFGSFKNFRKMQNIFAIFFENSEFGAVQRIANLLDLAKRCKMSIWLQNSALIQPRTSPLKFD